MSRNAREQSVLETLGIFLTWNGAIGTLLPVDHCLAWRRGPNWWRHAIDWFVARPEVTRSVAIAELAGGLWLILKRRHHADMRHAAEAV
jgi:hypothetical protein